MALPWTPHCPTVQHHLCAACTIPHSNLHSQSNFHAHTQTTTTTTASPFSADNECSCIIQHRRNQQWSTRVAINCPPSVQLSSQAARVSLEHGPITARGDTFDRKHVGKGTQDEGRGSVQNIASERDGNMQCVKSSSPLSFFFFYFFFIFGRNQAKQYGWCYYKSPIEMKSSKQYGLISSGGTTWRAQLRPCPSRMYNESVRVCVCFMWLYWCWQGSVGIVINSAMLLLLHSWFVPAELRLKIRAGVTQCRVEVVEEQIVSQKVSRRSSRSLAASDKRMIRILY